MAKGKRYQTEGKLNYTKVFAVIIAIAVVIMFIFIIKGLLTKDTTSGKITTKNYFTSYKDNKCKRFNKKIARSCRRKRK